MRRRSSLTASRIRDQPSPKQQRAVEASAPTALAVIVSRRDYGVMEDESATVAVVVVPVTTAESTRFAVRAPVAPEGVKWTVTVHVAPD
jgi:hypothetical protein